MNLGNAIFLVWAAFIGGLMVLVGLGKLGPGVVLPLMVVASAIALALDVRWAK